MLDADIMLDADGLGERAAERVVLLFACESSTSSSFMDSKVSAFSMAALCFLRLLIDILAVVVWLGKSSSFSSTISSFFLEFLVVLALADVEPDDELETSGDSISAFSLLRVTRISWSFEPKVGGSF